MAWTAPVTWLAGSTLTAAQLNEQVRDNSLAGGPIYTTEALRDAAIPAPFEGQRAYITASTVAAASVGGGVPTGIQTIYNGAAWVCVTPVSAFNAASGTRTGTYSATLAGTPGTNPTVTLSTGTSALVMISHFGNVSSAGVESSMSVAVSGAGTVAASNNFRTVTALNGYVNSSTTFVYTGLTAGNNTFELQYQCSGATGDFQLRRLIVQGIA